MDFFESLVKTSISLQILSINKRLFFYSCVFRGLLTSLARIPYIFFFQLFITSSTVQKFNEKLNSHNRNNVIKPLELFFLLF